MKMIIDGQEFDKLCRDKYFMVTADLILGLEGHSKRYNFDMNIFNAAISKIQQLLIENDRLKELELMNDHNFEQVAEMEQRSKDKANKQRTRTSRRKRKSLKSRFTRR